jgi:hypothetical protein
LAILRALAPGRSLGVAWWLFPDEHHNDDGGHREYLEREKGWRHFDPELFDALLKIDEEKSGMCVLSRRLKFFMALRSPPIQFHAT